MKKILVVIALFGFIAPAGFAQEGKIRQASQNRIVKAAADGSLTFSATGKPGDVFKIKVGGKDQFQLVFPRREQNTFIIRQVIAHSGGWYTFRLRFPQRSIDLYEGGTARVVRSSGGSNLVIDADRIVR